LLLSITTGRDDNAQRVGVLSFDPDALAQADKFLRGSRVYLEGSLTAKIWTDSHGQPRVDLSIMSFHTRLAQIGRYKAKRERETSVAGGYISPRSAPAGRLPGELNDEIPFAPEAR
jgi:single-stranded DNA-binding protein